MVLSMDSLEVNVRHVCRLKQMRILIDEYLEYGNNNDQQQEELYQEWCELTAQIDQVMYQVV